jgi:hypothetical protein
MKQWRRAVLGHLTRNTSQVRSIFSKIFQCTPLCRRGGAERLLKMLRMVAHPNPASREELGVLKTSSLDKVAVKTTGMEKAIVHPVGRKLFNRIRVRLVKEAESLNIPLRLN